MTISRRFSLSLLFILVSTFYPPNAFAQNFTQRSLPEGAIARLGKGRIMGPIAYSPDSRQLAVPSSIGIWIYEAETGEALDLLTGHEGWVRCATFSPDGATLASGSDDETIRLWNAETGEHLCTLIGHERWIFRRTRWVTSVAFSPDGTTLASRSSDMSIRLWNVKTGTQIHWLKAHSGSVSSVAFSPDGAILVSAGPPGMTLQAWNVQTGTLLWTHTADIEDVWRVAFSPDGTTIVSAGPDRFLRGAGTDGTIVEYERCGMSKRVNICTHLGIRIGELDGALEWHSPR